MEVWEWLELLGYPPLQTGPGEQAQNNRIEVKRRRKPRKKLMQKPSRDQGENKRAKVMEGLHRQQVALGGMRWDALQEAADDSDAD
ncbi:hypothetical protein NDU88_003049 [Pleurodeles waltl]|uniref:Uncharacterized protein n=1 Tax=Pleurodeles waltl TaxID=8319 RepID=A0AAV7MR66_PLEWA|nr:hypothetical protein NDU88_003049 [Pleurodeles waltl]